MSISYYISSSYVLLSLAYIWLLTYTVWYKEMVWGARANTKSSHNQPPLLRTYNNHHAATAPLLSGSIVTTTTHSQSWPRPPSQATTTPKRGRGGEQERTTATISPFKTIAHSYCCAVWCARASMHHCLVSISYTYDGQILVNSSLVINISKGTS